MSVPERVRNELKYRLWSLADGFGWARLSPSDKSKHYEAWTHQKDVGGLLARYIDSGKVRVYIKDSLLKGYAQDRLAGSERPLRVAGIEEPVDVVADYQKPHGRRLADGRIICWGRAEDWKTVLMALHERSYSVPNSSRYCAVLMFADGRFRDADVRAMVQDASKKLSIERLIWLDV